MTNAIRRPSSMLATLARWDPRLPCLS